MKSNNLIHPQHQQLRSKLFEAALELQETDFSEPQQAAQALDLLQRVTELCGQHEEEDSNGVLMLLQEFEPSIKDVFDRDCAKHRVLLQLLRESMKLYPPTENRTDREEAGRMIKSAFDRFLIHCLSQFQKEEEVIGKRLGSYKL